ncbi:MAG: hypothetical protein KDJ65_12190 [Anaerolineae bacterium]|nr:hypothetical protein [Anaerolineae bacterium]
MANIDEFEKSFYNLKRQGTQASPKTVTLIVIAWEPKGKGEPALNRSELQQLFFGPRDSVASWFYEVSQGRYRLVPHPTHPVLGPFISKYWWPFYWRNDASYVQKYLTNEEWERNPYKVPPSRESPHSYEIDGRVYYLDDEGYIGGHTHSWAEAIRQGAEVVDFSMFDRNNDKYLSPDEVLFMIVKAGPGRSAFGTRRSVTGSDVPRIDLKVNGVIVREVCELYAGTPLESNDLAVASEEILHLAANLADQYPDYDPRYPEKTYFRYPNDPGRPGQLSLTDAGHRPVHVDPYHKLKWGWLNPQIADKSGTYHLQEATKTGDALIVPSPIRDRKDEFFIIENRWRGDSFDRYRHPNRGDGLAVWHCIEDIALVSDWGRRAVHLRRADPRLDANGHIRWEKALFDGADPTRSYVLSDSSTPQHLRLRNNAPSGIVIQDISPAGPKMSLRVTLITHIEVEKYQPAWNHKYQSGIIVMLFKGGGFKQLNSLDYATYMALLDQLRNEKPVYYDPNQDLLLTRHELTGENEM